MSAAKKGCAKVHNLLGIIYWKEFEADPHEATQTKFLDHWKFAAAAGCQESLDNTKEFGVDMHGIISEEEFDGVREECEEARKIEWTEDREEWSKDRFRGRVDKMLQQKRQRAQAEEKAVEGGA